MAEEQRLIHKIVKDDADDSGIKIPGVSENDIVNQFVVHDDFIFQRFRIFNNGLIVCEEISHGQRVFRSNKAIF